MRILLILFLFFSSICSLEVDSDWLKMEIENNPQNITERVLLARILINQEKLLEAKKLINKVLSLDENNKKAQFLSQEIKQLEQLYIKIGDDKLTKSQKLTSYLEKLYKNSQYKELTLVYELLKRNSILLHTKVHLDAINSYTFLKKYKEAVAITENLSLNLEDKKSLLAKIYDKKEKEKEKEKTLYFKGIYNKEKTFESLKQYFFRLKDLGEKDDSLALLVEYNKMHPKDEESLLFIANNLYWNYKIDESLLVLKQVIDHTKNQDIIKLYSNILQEQGDGVKAIPYLEKLLSTSEDSQVAQQIENIKKKRDLSKADIILKKAIVNHKKSNYQKALSQYLKYYKRVKDPKIAKEIAWLFQLLNKEKKALFYFKEYLQENPKDHVVRFGYASALDNLKRYTQSQYQYQKVASIRGDLQPLALYRYANSLMKQRKEKKWDKARVIFAKLETKLLQQEQSKSRDDLLKHTQIALKIVSEPMKKPTRYKDIILGEGQEKLLGDDETFRSVKIEKRDIFTTSGLLKPDQTDNKKFSLNNIDLNLFFLEDSTIKSSSYGVRANSIAQYGNASLSVELKRSTFENKLMRFSANSFETHLDYKNFSAAVGINKFQDFNNPLLQLSYRKPHNNHDLVFGFKYTNGAYINNRVCMVKQRVNVMQFSLYDAILLSTLEQAEVNVKINRYDDKNTHINSWINYPLSKIIYKDFENLFSLSGSYEYNSKQDTCYYPTDFFDANFMQIKPKIYLGSRGFIQGIGGVGYSFKNSDFLYNYGLIISIRVNSDISFRVDCRHYQSGYSPKGADECYLALLYAW